MRTDTLRRAGVFEERQVEHGQETLSVAFIDDADEPRIAAAPAAATTDAAVRRNAATHRPANRQRQDSRRVG